MLQTHPEIIPIPFAQEGTKNVIPVEYSEPGSANATWKLGFPQITRTAKVAGGKPPLGLDFQGIFYQITNHLYWQQAGGIYTWNATLNYFTGNVCRGSDGKVYRCLQPCGPEVPAGSGTYVGAKNPISDTAYWVEVLYYGGDGINVTRNIISLTQTGVTAGSYGPTANKTLANGGNYKVPAFTVDKYGRISAAATYTFTLPKFTGGNGIDVSDSNVISVKNGSGLNFDSNGKLQVNNGTGLNFNSGKLQVDSAWLQSQMPTVPEYYAGTGLIKSGTTFSVDENWLAGKMPSTPTIPEQKNYSIIAGTGISVKTTANGNNITFQISATGGGSGGGSGGGTSYSAGSGINISSSNVISVDEIWLAGKIGTGGGGGGGGTNDHTPGVEIWGTSSTKTPFIDFHYGGSSQDWTARIIENESGFLQLAQNTAYSYTIPTDDKSTKIATTQWVRNAISTYGSSGSSISHSTSFSSSSSYAVIGDLLINFGYKVGSSSDGTSKTISFAKSFSSATGLAIAIGGIANSSSGAGGGHEVSHYNATKSSVTFTFPSGTGFTWIAVGKA